VNQGCRIHLNTPPGVAAVNGYIVYYIDISLQGGHAAATVLGVAHPWAFESGLIGVGQDEINSGLDGTVQGTTDPVQEFLNIALGKIPGTYSYVYLLPGIVTHQGTSPVTGDASRDITLALAPNLLHGPIVTKPIG